MGSSKSFAFLVLLLVLLVSQPGVLIRPAEGRMCESSSHHYKGACFRDHNCAMVCRTEGFSGGNCRGFRRRCFCTRRC